MLLEMFQNLKLLINHYCFLRLLIFYTCCSCACLSVAFLLLVTFTWRQTISKSCFTYIISHSLVMTNPYIIPYMFRICFRPEHSHVKLSLCIISIPVILYLICRDRYYHKLSDWLTISNILCVIAGISTLLFILQDMGYFSISERLVTMFV